MTVAAPRRNLSRLVRRQRDSAWHLYEARKATWIHHNPNAKSADYQAAMKRIAEECNV